MKILSQAYGREGPRRRVLIKDLLEPEEEDLPQDNIALSQMITGVTVSSQAAEVNPTKRFDAFLKSQLTLPSEIQRGQDSFKELKPKIPPLNIWGRPMPLKRQANLRKEWWAQALDKIHPPVPHHEWDRLRGLATGVTPMWNFILPRKAPEDPEKLAVVDYELVVNNLRNPAREVGTLEWRADHKQVFVAPKNKEIQIGKKTLKTAYNFQRTMRRIYARIWAITPKMYKDLDTKEWVVEWGDASSQILEDPVAILSGNQLELFEGLDGKAKENHISKKPQRKNQIKNSKQKAEPTPSSTAQEAESSASEGSKDGDGKISSAVDESGIIRKEKQIMNWDPESSYWKPEPPSLEDPPETPSELVRKKLAEETTGVSKEAMARLASRQKELLGKKGGRGIMRTLPTRKELGANKKT